MDKAKFFYSPKTGGFYDTRFHHDRQIPRDAVEVSRDQHLALHNGRANGGKIVMFNGRPTLEESAPPSLEDRREAMREKLDLELNVYVHKKFVSFVFLKDVGEMDKWVDGVVTPYCEEKLQAIDTATEPEKVSWDFAECDRGGVSDVRVGKLMKLRKSKQAGASK